MLCSGLALALCALQLVPAALAGPQLLVERSGARRLSKVRRTLYPAPCIPHPASRTPYPASCTPHPASLGHGGGCWGDSAGRRGGGLRHPAGIAGDQNHFQSRQGGRSLVFVAVQGSGGPAAPRAGEQGWRLGAVRSQRDPVLLLSAQTQRPRPSAERLPALILLLHESFPARVLHDSHGVLGRAH